MHPMIIAGVLVHVLALAVVAFFVLFAAQRAKGLVKSVGNVLGVVMLVVSLLAIVGAATAPMFGGKPFGLGHGAHMEFRVMHRESVESAPAEEAEAAQPEEESAPAQ